MSCEERDDYHFGKIMSITQNILIYLLEKSEKLWKLLYYTDPKQIPLNEPNLTDAQKRSMICITPKEYYTTSTATKKNVLLVTEIDEGFTASVPQIRICTGRKGKFNPYQGYCEIYIQVVVPNKQLIYNDTTLPLQVGDRTDAILSELMLQLDNKIIPNSSVNSPLFVNRSAPDGAGTRTGIERDVANKNFSQQWLTMSCLI